MDSKNSKKIVPSSPSRGKTNAPTEAIGLHTELLFGKAGRIIQAIDSISGTLGKEIDISFPQIIVAGEESSGKSSVLERIAMLQFFPRDEDVCTRMPTKLRLQHLSLPALKEFCGKNGLAYGEKQGYVRLKFEGIAGEVIYSEQFYGLDEVEKQVKIHMDKAVSARQGSVSGVVEDVLIIEVTSYMVPNLTLVDLPGIFCGVKGNEKMDMPRKTEELVAKYMQQPHTMVLVVVPAFQRIRNSKAIELIQRYKKEKDCIGVLTMSDRSYDVRKPDDPYYELKRKLDGTAPDCIVLPLGYVAVRNRDNTEGTKRSLYEAAQLEATWFDENLPGYRDKGKASSDALITRLVTMLCNYIETTWVPFAKKKIEDRISVVNGLIADIGVDPSVNSLNLLTSLVQAFKNTWCQSFDQTTTYHSNLITDVLKMISDSVNLSPENILSTNKLSEAVKFKKYKENISIKATGVLSIIANLIAKDAYFVMKDSKRPLRIERFEKLHFALTSWLKKLCDENIQKAKSRLISDLHFAFTSINLESTRNHSLELNYIGIKTTTTIVMEEMLIPIISRLEDLKNIESQVNQFNPNVQDLLTESTAKQRSDLQEQLKNLQIALKEVTSLQKEEEETY